LSQILRFEPGTRLERLLVSLAEDSRDDDEIAGDLVEAIARHRPVRPETYMAIQGIHDWRKVRAFDWRAVVEREAWGIAFEERFPCASLDWPFFPGEEGEVAIHQASALYYYWTRWENPWDGFDAEPLDQFADPPSTDPGYNAIWRMVVHPLETVRSSMNLEVPTLPGLEVTWPRLFDSLLIQEAGRLGREALLDCVPLLCWRKSAEDAAWWLHFWVEEFKTIEMEDGDRASILGFLTARSIIEELARAAEPSAAHPDGLDLASLIDTVFFGEGGVQSRLDAWRRDLEDRDDEPSPAPTTRSPRPAS